MKIEDAYFLIEKTKKDYDFIFQEFDRTRKRIWPEFQYFKDFFVDGQKILDFGCGNGRFYFLIQDKNISYYGVDISEKLLFLAKENVKNGQFFLISKELDLPFSNNFFDIIVCLATFHHIPSFTLRMKLLKEFYRVLKPNGLLILSVWDFYHGKNKKYLFKFFFDWLKNKIQNKIFKKKPSLDWKDFFVPWKNQKGEVVINRYFHAFTLKELKNLIQKANFKIKESKILSHNEKRNFYNLVVISQKEDQKREP